jgi:hypothetical protein
MEDMKKNIIFFVPLLILLLLSNGCAQGGNDDLPERESLIPVEAIKMSPENDPLPPQLHSDEFEAPLPLPYPVNTCGVEDSAFIMPDGQTLYLWFTPDNRMDVAEQARDKVTGIYKFEKEDSGWSGPERIWLADPDEPHLDGCGFFQGDKLWICAVRQGLEGMHWMTSTVENGQWSRAVQADFNPEYEVGELHISADGSQLYFHSARSGGKGGLDIWVSSRLDGEWQAPVNLENVNSEYDDGWPVLNPQEDELWITKNYGLWRSKKVNGEWQTPELVISTLAGEASLDRNGNVYFTHHYFESDQMIEADIYVAMRK